LRDGAGLEKRVVLLGMDYRFEIWNENTLNTRRAEEVSVLSEQASEDLDRLVL
jgi:DNA-binding transcriptional regulator/RsmH inhibitor MraZ